MYYFFWIIFVYQKVSYYSVLKGESLNFNYLLHWRHLSGILYLKDLCFFKFSFKLFFYFQKIEWKKFLSRSFSTFEINFICILIFFKFINLYCRLTFICIILCMFLTLCSRLSALIHHGTYAFIQHIVIIKL